MKEGATPYITNKLTVPEKSKVVFSEVHGSELYWNLRCRVKEELLKNKSIQQSTMSASVEDMIGKLVRDLNLESELKNKVYEVYDSLLKEETPYTWASFKLQDCQNISMLPPFYTHQSQQETLDSIVQAKSLWDEFLKQRVDNLQKALEKPIIRRRVEPVEPEKKELEESKDDEDKTEELEEEDEKDAMPPRAVLYEATTLLSAIMKIRSDNYAADPALAWGSIRVMLQTRSLEELRSKFAELNVALRQVGIDEERGFIDERLLIGERLLQKNAVPLLTQFAKRGIPHTLRPAVYKKLLNAEYGEKGAVYFDKLQDHHARWELVLDDVVRSDIREFCNDDKYFIFEDVITPALTSFFRDPYVVGHCRVSANKPLIGYSDKEIPVGHIPSSGVLPCSYFTRYIGPLAYMSEKAVELYYIFRGIYTKYVCCLHSITSHPQGIISLAKLFEDLLQIYEPDVWFHMQQIGVSPLKVAFPWIFYVFVGYLEVDQLLYIWDRIIGFDSLEILPILAAAIFSFRAKRILNCNNQEDVDEIFYDLHQLKAIPLIQHFLFATETP